MSGQWPAPWPLIMAPLTALAIAVTRRRKPPHAGAETIAAAERLAEADDYMAIADAVREERRPAVPAPVVTGELTERDREFLDQIAADYHHIDPVAAGRGHQVADLLRRTCPSADDAYLSRGILRTIHLLGFIAWEAGDPGCYGHVLAELGVAAHDLTAFERAEPMP